MMRYSISSAQTSDESEVPLQAVLGCESTRPNLMFVPNKSRSCRISPGSTARTMCPLPQRKHGPVHRVIGTGPCDRVHRRLAIVLPLRLYSPNAMCTRCLQNRSVTRTVASMTRRCLHESILQSRQSPQTFGRAERSRTARSHQVQRW